MQYKCRQLEKQINFIGGLVVDEQILWEEKNTDIKYFPVYGNNRFIGLKLCFGSGDFNGDPNKKKFERVSQCYRDIILTDE